MNDENTNNYPAPPPPPPGRFIREDPLIFREITFKGLIKWFLVIVIFSIIFSRCIGIRIDVKATPQNQPKQYKTNIFNVC